jgi:hypothetical protein
MQGRQGRHVRQGRQRSHLLAHQNPKAPSGTILFVLVPGRIMIVDASECPEWFGIVFVDDFVLVDRNGLKPLET